jgi:hypothetical protein
MDYQKLLSSMPEALKPVRFTHDRLVFGWPSWSAKTVADVAGTKPFKGFPGLQVEDERQFSLPATKELGAALYALSNTEGSCFPPIVPVKSKAPYLYGNDRPLVGFLIGSPELIDRSGNLPPHWQVGIGDKTGEIFIYVDPEYLFSEVLTPQPGEHPPDRPTELKWCGIDMMPLFDQWEKDVFAAPAQLIHGSFTGWKESHYHHPLDLYGHIPHYADRLIEIEEKKEALAQRVRDRVMEDPIAVAGALLALRATILGPVDGLKYLETYHVQIQGLSFAVAGQKIAQLYGWDWCEDQIFDNNIIALC